MKNLIILPVFNRAALIRNALLHLAVEIDENTEILVIDDGSDDNTSELIETDHQVKLIHHENTLGYGGCIVTALDFAKMNNFDTIFILDISYEGFIRAFKDMREFNKEYDVLNCSRYSTVVVNKTFTEDNYVNYNFSLQISSKINSLTGYNLEDVFSPFKAIKLKSLTNMVLEEFDEAIIIQLFIQAKFFKLKVSEIFCDSVQLEINRDDLNLENDMEYYMNFIEGEKLLYPA